MTFQKEADFEEALIKVLADKGWEKEVIKNPTEQDLIRNWAKILYDNNRGIDRLNNYPLTDGEMQQIIEQITELRTPLKPVSYTHLKHEGTIRMLVVLIYEQSNSILRKSYCSNRILSLRYRNAQLSPRTSELLVNRQHSCFRIQVGPLQAK